MDVFIIYFSKEKSRENKLKKYLDFTLYFAIKATQVK